MPNPFFRRDILSMKDFAREELELLFETTDKLLEMRYRERVALGEGRILGIMFFEPSTRTRPELRIGDGVDRRDFRGL